jgi:hypothetical protein
MRPHKSVKEQTELTEQLAAQIHSKNQGIKRLAWGVVLGIFNLVLDGLYNAFLFLVARGDLKASWVRNLAQFLMNNFSFLFIIWLLSWVAVLVMVISGLRKLLAARGEIEQIKLELERLKIK